VRSVLDIKKSSNGAATTPKIDASSAASDIQRELHYRLAAKEPTTEDLYRSVAWSVHNRLLDSFEQTHDYWK
jgi:hypothetical protein